MQVDYVRGAQAWSLLAEPSFNDAWDRVADRCPWATIFQRRPFLSIWYDCYRERFDPLMVIGRGEDSQIEALWFLAVDRSSDELVGAGTHHSEYHGWAATPDQSAEFVRAAFETIAAANLSKRLTLVFLAPGIPLEWVGAGKGYRAFARPHRRGLMVLGDASPTEKSLRKKSNKSRLSRLRRVGDVDLTRAASRAELEPWIDEIAQFCDLRQGAINGATPFLSDPLKRELHLRLADEPDLLHSVLLRVGDQIGAVHIGGIDRGSVLLGLISHSPFLAKHSPGKLILLLLGRMLAEQGYERFDMTPGGDYKDRFATEWDEVVALDVFFDRRLQLAYSAKRSVRTLVKPLLAGIPATPKKRAGEVAERARTLLKRGILRSGRNALKVLASRTWSDDEYRFYRLEPEEIPAREEFPEGCRVDSIEDLLAFNESAMDGVGYETFLRQSIDRLEAGGRVTTFRVDGELAHYSWLTGAASSVGSEFGHQLELDEPGVVLWDDYTAPKFRGRGLHGASLRARLELARRSGMTAYIGVAARNGPSRHNIEKAGFKLCRRGFVKRRLGRTRLWLDEAGESTPRL